MVVSRRKGVLFHALFFMLMFLSVELLSAGSLFFLKKIRNIDYQPAFPISQQHKQILRKLLEGSSTYYKFDPTLGWTIRPNSESKNHLYRSNAEGFRADRDYSTAPPPGRIRIAAFGDSFTHCDDVSNPETWESQLELIDQRLEVLNFGVGGYGLDQAFLRYKKKGAGFHPRIVLIGFMSENINRMVTTFKPFYFKKTSIPLAKPRFVLQADQLTLLRNPISTQHDLTRLLCDDQELFEKLKANDYYARSGYARTAGDFLAIVRLMTLFPSIVWNRAQKDEILNNGIYNTSSEAYRVTTRLMDEFYRLAESNASMPIIVLFPSKFDLEGLAKGKVSYGPLIEHLNRKGYRYIDLWIPLRAIVDNKEEIKKWTLAHYSSEANKLIARYIYSFLKNGHLLEKPGK
ncbi:MAG: SGNH/GDSL hydrolase family protein [Candidatus Omnitrophota bacterium]